MQSLVILGTGGNSQDILDILDAIHARAPSWSVLGFLDDVRPAGSLFCGHEVLGPLDKARAFTQCRFINAIGSDRSFRRREDTIEALNLEEGQFATLVHPMASISRRATLGQGVCVNAGVTLGGSVKVGHQVWLGSGCTVGHDSEIGDYAVIAPGAIISGSVLVGPNCFIGAGAVVRQSVRMGAGALIGMGAVVLRDVEPGTTVVGNPARPLFTLKESTGNGFSRKVKSE